MSVKSNKSIGSLETWEPDDKSFSKHTFKDGTGETKPNEGSVCTVNIMPVGDMNVEEEDLGGYKLNEDVEVTIGEGDTKLSVLFDKVVTSLLLGETAYIKAKVNAKGQKVSEFEFKEKGLKFNVTLKAFDRASESADLEQDERLDRAQHHKEKGTELYQKGVLDFAQDRYEKALSYLKDMEPATDLPGELATRYQKLKCQCFLNLAACHLSGDEFDKVTENCTAALELEPDNVKGLFRRGQAYAKLNQYEKAKDDFTKAQSLDKDNKAVTKQLHLVNSKMQKEKQMYQKMFST